MEKVTKQLKDASGELAIVNYQLKLIREMAPLRIKAMDMTGETQRAYLDALSEVQEIIFRGEE